MRLTRWIPALLTLVFALLVASEAKATTYSHHWCFRWRVYALDRNIGEDYGTASTWVGRGAKVRISHATAGTQTHYTSKSTGCIDFEATASSNFTVTIYAETRIGDQDNIKVRAFESEDNYDTWKTFPLNDNLEHWLWYGITPSCNGTSCSLTLTNTSQVDPVSIMIAAGTWTVHQVDSYTSPHMSGTKELFLINDDCSGGGSCAAGDILYIQEAGDGGRRKFLIGHETGHWLKTKWGSNHGGNYSVNDWDANDPVCDSTSIPGNHALRSAEYSSGGFGEGFAHYLSTLAFNNHGQTDAWFKYYKGDIDGYDYDYDLVNVENGDTGGYTAWLRHENGCECSESQQYGCDGYGVELDWLRHYWDYRTNAGTQPSHWDIFDHVADTDVFYGGFGTTQAHDRLEARVQSEFASRWDEMADYNAADPTID